jgi:Bacterial conjugation TrbI-like protein
MDNDYQTTVVEPEKNVALPDGHGPDEEVTAKALEEIRSTERLSGFGRFARRLQGLFRASRSSQSKQEISHLKPAPIMMSVGLLLLLATGVLFVLSKPERTVPSQFRQLSGLAGSNHQSSVGTASAEPPVTEDELAGQDASAGAATASRAAKKRAIETTSPDHFSFADSGNSPAQTGVGSRPNELGTPATVFVDEPPASAVPKEDIAAPTSGQTGLQLPVGTEFVAHTTNAISSGLESPVVAVVDRPVQLGNTVVIPEGARVIGQTAGEVKNRVNVRFTSVVLPSDREMAISGLALMEDGSAGLVGKVKGKHNPVLAGAARIGTGAAVVATEFAGQGSLNQPFSQSDYLRNQMASEVAAQGSQLSNRLQQLSSVPIVMVDAGQPITIFLLERLAVSGKTIRSGNATPQPPQAVATAKQKQPSDQALIEAQTDYIQALEAQLAETRASSGKNPNEHQ